MRHKWPLQTRKFGDHGHTGNSEVYMSKKDFAEESDVQNAVEAEQDTQEQEAQEDSAKQTTEKMLPVSRVNELIKKAKYDGEKKMQQQLEEMKAQLEQAGAGEQPQAVQQPPEQQQGGGQMGGMQQMSQADIEAAIQKQMEKQAELQRQQQLQQEVNQVAEQFYDKMSQGAELYDDFEEIAGGFDAKAFPSIVYLANLMDNTPAIIYELQKNPSKLTHLDRLVEKSPQSAQREIAKLSQSIKSNQEAQQQNQDTQEPLGRMKPSKVGADNGEYQTVRDFKNASWLKA